MNSQTWVVRRTLAPFVVVFIIACGGSDAAGGPGGGSKVSFDAPDTLKAYANTSFVWSFCDGVATASDLCDDDFNPTGGTPPYHFVLGSGVGFPPVGVVLGLNGILAGTPTTMGTTSTFAVCAVDVAAKQSCQTIVMPVGGITASPTSITISGADCYPATCTLSKTVSVTSTTPWTSAVYGLAGLGDEFFVSPAAGPAGTTTVTLSYKYTILLTWNNGEVEFKTTKFGVSVVVPVKTTH